MHRASQASAPPPNTPVDYDVMITVEASPFQTDWRGVGALYNGFAGFTGMGLSPAQRTAQYDLARLSGIKYARTWFGQEWVLPSYPAGPYDWATANMTGFREWVQAMKD